MTANGSRLFVAGSVLLILFACGHFTGFLSARRAARNDPALADLTRAMREHKSDLAGFHPSILDFREYFSASFSLLLLLAGALNLIALGSAGDPAAAIRRLSLANGLAMVILLALSVLHSIFQGIVTCGVIALVFLAAFLRARTA